MAGIASSEAASTPAPRMGDFLQTLADLPGLLLGVMLLVNAIVLPYLGIVHDARLYSIQTHNRVHDGAFGHDLFLRYGSQDKYSLFSTIAAPLAQVLGIHLAFFLIYLVSRGLFFLGLQQFLFRLLGATPATVIGLLILSVDPISFGGYGVFHVNEAFTTPRLPACGLVLLGLTALLNSRWIVAILCMLTAASLHPLMASAGLAMVIGWAMVQAFGRWGWPVLLAAMGIGFGALLVPPLGHAVLGHMDAEWMEQIRLAIRFNFPLEWRPLDWIRIGMTLVALGMTITCLGRQQREGQFLGLLAIVGLYGLAVNTLGTVLSYTGLIQIQSYRILWISHLLTLPCWVYLTAKAWQSTDEKPRLLALAFGFLLIFLDNLDLAFWLMLLLWPIAVVAMRGLLPLPRRSDWRSASLAISVAGAAILSSLWVASLFVGWMPHLLRYFETADIRMILWARLGWPIWSCVAVLLVAILGTRLIRKPMPCLIGLLVATVLIQTTAYAVFNSTWHNQDRLTHQRDCEFVAQVLGKHRAETTPPTVYWPVTQLHKFPLEMAACPYFEIHQLSGILFRKETATESFRRARRVAHLQLAGYQPHEPFLPHHYLAAMPGIYGIALDEAKPTTAHLVHLVQDPILDYVVLEMNLGEPVLAGNGHIYIYDARQIRESQSGR